MKITRPGVVFRLADEDLGFGPLNYPAWYPGIEDSPRYRDLEDAQFDADLRNLLLPDDAECGWVVATNVLDPEEIIVLLLSGWDTVWPTYESAFAASRYRYDDADLRLPSRAAVLAGAR